MDRVSDKYYHYIAKYKYGDKVIKFLIDHQDDFMKTKTISSIAVKNNRLDILITLKDGGYNFDKGRKYSWISDVTDLCCYAIKCNNMEILKWLVENVTKPSNQVK